MNMIRIGSFARIAQVSTRALRLYDKLGLLKPAVVDPDTDYRYYSIDQLPRLNRILALKDLGFSLEQIAGVLRGELSAEQLRGMLVLKRIEPQWAAVVRGTIPDYITSEPIFITLFEQLDAYLARHSVRQPGPRMALFYDLGTRDHDIDVRAGVILPAPIPSDDRVEVYQLPAVKQMACVVHHGPYDETLI